MMSSPNGPPAMRKACELLGTALRQHLWYFDWNAAEAGINLGFWATGSVQENSGRRSDEKDRHAEEIDSARQLTLRRCVSTREPPMNTSDEFYYSFIIHGAENYDRTRTTTSAATTPLIWCNNDAGTQRHYRSRVRTMNLVEQPTTAIIIQIYPWDTLRSSPPWFWSKSNQRATQHCTACKLSVQRWPKNPPARY